MAGASQVVSSGFKVVAKASVKAGKKVSSGIKVTKNVKILSPDKLYNRINGETLVKIGKVFRVDVNSEIMLHAHFLGSFAKKHFPLGVIKFLGENPGACPWDEAKKYFSKSLMSISSEYTLQI